MVPGRGSNLAESTSDAERRVHGPPESFWRQLAQADRRLLMLDYDGTLAPFQVIRMKAVPDMATLAALKRIVLSTQTRVVIVSGRPAEQVAALLGDLPVTIVGAHGFERFEHLEGTRQNTLSALEISGLEVARAAAAAAGLEERIEEKPASIAVHTRGLGPEDTREVEELTWNVWTPIALEYGLECRPFSGGVEIRSRNYHKGIAVETLLLEMPDGIFAVYIGDDDTDEDAFGAVAGRGVGIKVGALTEGSDARWTLPDTAAVTRFLQKWHETAGREVAAVKATARDRLVVLSNRLPAFDGSRRPGARSKAAGGLAVAVDAALKYTGGGMWVGWSGRIRRASDPRALRMLADDPVPVLGLDLSEREIEAYYNGFCNHALWPLLHSFQGKVALSSWEHEVYREVNLSFAQLLRPQLADSDLVWVHDYHLIHVAEELRRLHFKGLCGFFLHVPFPSLDLLAILPDYRGFLEALTQYDLIGFHTQGYLDNYLYAVRRVLHASWDGRVLRVGDRAQKAGIYPAGIDPSTFLPPSGEDESRARRGTLKAAIRERRIILGVDRLDYTKGIPERILGFERLMRMKPDLKRKVSLLQICAPSRTRVKEYMDQKRAMDALVGRISAELGEHDWEPVRYLYRSYPQSDLAQFYRDADLGLVTPLRDGMNLVAKEYVAAQRPDDPGVLVLSRFAGAADELSEAVLVNPHLPEDCAMGMATALQMPKEERVLRHRAMLEKVLAGTAERWAADFLGDLKSCRSLPGGGGRGSQ